MNREALLARLIAHEGLKFLPYRDSRGKLTIGIGRNLDDCGVTRDDALFLAGNDIAQIERGLDSRAPWWRGLDETRQQILAEMAFNLGLSGALGFTRMIAALRAGDFELAARKMLASAWARQVGGRARRLAGAMATGAFANEVSRGTP